MKAHEFTSEAGKLVSGDRSAAYGDVYEHYTAFAALVNGYLASVGKPIQLDALDAVTLLELMKINRRRFGPYREDNFVDGCGYTACAGEIASRETRR